ncbi:MAG TPA: NAD(P)H-hydrate dehydratase [Candidatus Cybelea sp.]|nr:NAD(P)H-hydrate dehydratase [Candidatus Cybelea sp.]
MIYVLTPEQMRAVDAAAVEDVGANKLMRNAGRRIAKRLRAMAKPGARIVAFAGPGNNGGDAFAALAELAPEYDCTVAADPATQGSEARDAARDRAKKAGVSIIALPANEREACELLENAIGVDGMFGTGARLPLPEAYRHLARALDARERAVLAIDIPSGTDALTGAISGDAVRATLTVTLAAAKPGLLLEPAREYVGELWCAPIGIDDALLAAQPRTFATLDNAEFMNLLPRRAADTEKRAAGAPLIIAGSAQFPGAAILCARGAARAGAGYVTVATPSSAAGTLRAHLVEQVVVALSDGARPEVVARELLDISKHNGAVAIGPGLGLDDRTADIFRLFLEANQLPVVVDASGLFHLSKHLDLLRDKPCVVTPHAGEFARLSGRGTIAPGTRVERIVEFVDRTGITTLLKGSDTLIYDGTTVHINPTGTSALATAGTGDVLTGIIATLLAQGLSPVDAARAGAYWHGLAGRRAAEKRRIGVVAGDVVDVLGEALPG